MNTKIISCEQDLQTAVCEAAGLILNGEVVAIPTETVYGLGANALCDVAVSKIFSVKGRPQDNPLIVHIADMEMAYEVANVSQTARRLMEEFWPGPLSVIVEKKDCIGDGVSAGLKTIALRMPKNEVAREIIRKAGVPIAAPSANVSGKPSPTLAKHVYEDLNGKIPLIIDGGPCEVGVESTVVQTVGVEIPTILRPGDVTPEMIGKIMGEVVLHESVCGKTTKNDVVMSPGMKYKHYAPKASVYVYEGDKKTVEKNVCSMYHNCKENAKNVVVFCMDDTAKGYEGLNLRLFGKDAKSAEAKFFAELREADQAKIDTILFHYENEMGLAIKNRIIRAAEKPQGEVTKTK